MKKVLIDGVEYVPKSMEKTAISREELIYAIADHFGYHDKFTEDWLFVDVNDSGHGDTIGDFVDSMLVGIQKYRKNNG